MKLGIWIVAAAFLAANAHACIWDADSLWQEKMRSHDLTSAILGEPPPPEDPQKLRARISDLETHRDETNADWWNNLAAAHLRLNEPAEAVKILEPVVTNFPDNYGIHANLGTAYHLLGRYADAEKEIARDLEINPDAHFGLEKYHLALLQYLVRDTNYQSRHFYVDEFTRTVFTSRSQDGWLLPPVTGLTGSDTTNSIPPQNLETDYEQAINSRNWYDAGEDIADISSYDPVPEYRTRWNLAADTNFEAGVIYMAQMNPKEPAAAEMLAVVAWQKHDYHLAATAFEKAIKLGSKKSAILSDKVEGFGVYIAHSRTESPRASQYAAYLGCLLCVPLLIFWGIYRIGLYYRRKNADSN